MELFHTSLFILVILNLMYLVHPSSTLANSYVYPCRDVLFSIINDFDCLLFVFSSAISLIVYEFIPWLVSLLVSSLILLFCMNNSH